jgi:nitroreductase
MELKTLIESRRAYRSLDPGHLSTEMIEKIIAQVQLTPSCFNHQPWRFVFVREPSQLDKLKTALNKGNEWAKESDLIIAAVTQKDLDCRIPPDREYYLFDTGMAVFNLILQLTESGLVAHPIAGYQESFAKDILEIPQEYQLITLIITGRHADTIKPALTEKQKETELKRPERKDIHEVFFFDRFQ